MIRRDRRVTRHRQPGILPWLTLSTGLTLLAAAAGGLAGVTAAGWWTA